MFSHRSDLDRTPNAFAQMLEGRDRSALLDLTESNPTRAQLPYPSEAVQRALSSSESLIYEPHPLGLPRARQAVAREVGVPPERIVLTASTSEAYAFAFKLLCDPGNDIAVPQPSYPLVSMIARFESVQWHPYELVYEGRWHVDVDSLRRAVGPRTRAVVTVSPNNPTGSHLTPAELDMLLDTGRALICDEVFAPYPLEAQPERMAQPLSADRGLVMSLGGLSKRAGLPQHKLGWIALAGAPSRIDEARARLELIADSFLSVGGPVQQAAPELLEHTRAVRDAIRQRTRRNLDAIATALGEASPVTRPRVEGGWYAVLRLPRVVDELAWSRRLLDRGVLVHPGWLYDFPDEAHVVVSLLTPPARFDQGMRRIAETVAAET